MENRGFFIFAIFVLIFLVVCSVFVFAVRSRFNNIPYIEDDSENITCTRDEDCIDENLCTLHYCDDGICRTTDVVLCYQNDGCCPSECTPENDNDCSLL